MILNLFPVEYVYNLPCPRCGRLLLQAVRQDRMTMFIDAEPDPLGRYVIAFGRGDNGENLVHWPFEEGIAIPDWLMSIHSLAVQRALVETRYKACQPLFSLHHCPSAGRVPERA